MRLLLVAGTSPYGFYHFEGVFPLIVATNHGQAKAARLLSSDPSFYVNNNKLGVERTMNKVIFGSYTSVIKILVEFEALIYHSEGGRSLLVKVKELEPLITALKVGRNDVVEVPAALGVKRIDPA